MVQGCDCAMGNVIAHNLHSGLTVPNSYAGRCVARRPRKFDPRAAKSSEASRGERVLIFLGKLPILPLRAIAHEL